MLTLQSQPSTLCPNPKSRPVRWLITTDEHIDDAGSPAFFQVEISGTGGPDGEDIILAGQTFTTDSGQPFTFNTFDPNGTNEQVATNMADAIRSNSYFQEYQVFLTSSGLDWIVNAFNFAPQEQPDWTFDDTGLTVLATAITESNGTTPDIKNMRLWYRLYSDQAPITNERFSAIIFNPDFIIYSEIPIDLTNVVRGILRSIMPSFDDVLPLRDQAYQENIHLRYGLVHLDDDCNEVRSLAAVSPNIYAVNSVHQLTDQREFRNHCPNFINKVKWLTDRPNSDVICSSQHEWVHIWIQNTGVFVGSFKVVYTLYDENDAVIGDIEETLNEADTAWIIPISSNLPTFASNTARYEIKIQGQVQPPSGPLQWQDYSELLTRRIITCNCIAAEVYFLEDRGSFRTLTFPKLESRAIEMQENTYRLPTDWENGDATTQYYFEGGRYSEAQIADSIFLLQTERLNNEPQTRYKYEQLLTSPLVYIKTMNISGTQVMRRIIFPKTAYETFRASTPAQKLEIPFRFNNSLIVH